jgi:hypothetical protein
LGSSGISRKSGSDLGKEAVIVAIADRRVAGDLDGDADVDLSDLAAVLAEYERICP